ncbi:Bax inhibitor-1/YccA family protein [Campylobacter sp. faydin G-24]|uniref:Bax inhibitor-1/YccA family protein n=1 Tax=Campylobacter anatolicus TaxID=2829105 RepID=A0ABS5HIT3_9BACT|nr:Bax inhibitor-1/YccA family protein [Campylobacter anatolicus]MBR8461537.1 Bax inhibitor-1/YccA family protein [Campylobacter anatolicus]MBR8464179.1 Bax inhibitor-1/YccA family protein [Campylobacter anatolicus]MBR8466085.1 Bax inhibitor-1/YccA family protein [Campylobacter anatolicus]
MSLYNRNYANQTHESEVAYSQSSLSTFIKQTYQLFAASLLSATAGSYVGISMSHVFVSNRMLFWGLVIVELGLLFGLMAAKRKAGLNMVLLFAFTFVSGLTLTPLLSAILSMPSGAAIVAQSFALTTVAFGGLSVFAMNTKRDFTTMSKMLFIALIVIIVASLINIFTQSPLFQLVIASVGAILFSAYILYDTQNIIRGNYETPIEGAVALYLDFVNLFTSLLQIFGILGRDE